MLIIGIIGNNRVGKDTASDFLSQYARKFFDINFKKYALADPIKDIARIMFGFTENQLYSDEKDQVDQYWKIKPREFFQKFGTEIMQFDIYKYLPDEFKNIVPEREFWVHSLFRKIQNNNDEYVMITDVRGNHEAKKIIEAGGYLIEIVRNRNSNNNNDHNNDHNINNNITMTPLDIEENIGQISGHITVAHITEVESKSIKSEYIFKTIENNGTLEGLDAKVKSIFLEILKDKKIIEDC